MKVAVIYNKVEVDATPGGVINPFGMPNKERYNPRTVEKVASALERGGHTVKVINGNMHLVDELIDFMPKVVAGERHGMVFNMAYGIQGQSRYTHIPAMLEMLGIPYVGSGPAAHGIALDKVISKFLFRQNNLPTPDFWVFSAVSEIPEDLPFPLIAKPKMEAVSFGLRVCHSREELVEACEFIITEFQQQVLVERFIAGREFAVGILGNWSPEILPVVEFDFNGDTHAIQSYEAKMKTPVEKVCPAQIPPDLEKQLKELTLGAFRALGIFDFGRVDLRMDEEGNIYLLELNSMASLGVTGSYVKAAKTAGYSYESLVNKMLEVAAVRYFGEGYLQDQKVTRGAEKEPKRANLASRVRSYCRSQTDTFVEFVEKMVAINSYVYNTEGVNALGSWYSQNLRQLGFQKQIIPLVEVGNLLYFTNHDSDDQNDILILAHLDNIYDVSQVTPFSIERGRIYGSGVSNSKGGLAVLLGALKALKYTRKLKNTRVGILLTTDDSLYGKFSASYIAEYARNAKKVISVKSGGRMGGLVTSGSGNLRYQILLSNITYEDTTEVLDLVNTLNQKTTAWQKLGSTEEGVEILVEQLEVQQRPGYANHFARVFLSVSYAQKDQYTSLNEKIRRIAEKPAKKHLQVHVTRLSRRPPVVDTAKSKQFFEEVVNMASQLEIKVQGFHRSYSSDLGHIAAEIPVLGGFGPAGAKYPSVNEYIIKDSIVDRAALLALVINKSSELR